MNIARRARFLDSWQSYRKAGVNIALGTDTYPRDMILQMPRGRISASTKP